MIDEDDDILGCYLIPVVGGTNEPKRIPKLDENLLQNGNLIKA